MESAVRPPVTWITPEPPASRKAMAQVQLRVQLVPCETSEDRIGASREQDCRSGAALSRQRSAAAPMGISDASPTLKRARSA